MNRSYLCGLAVVCFLAAVLAAPAAAAVRRVKWDSPNIGPGSDWANAYQTIQTAIAASAAGDEVWVAGNSAHPYVGCITLKIGVGLYGGFVGTETTRDQRNWRANETIIDGNGCGNVVTSPAGAAATTVLDGFGIRKGVTTIWCNSSSPTIKNNTLSTNSYGIVCDNSAATITNNMVLGSSVYGVVANPGSTTSITNNTICGAGTGVFCSADNSKPSTPGITNNIIAYNGTGIGKSGSLASPVLMSNCVFNPDGTDYSGLGAGSGDFSANPRFVNEFINDFHLGPGSPCVEAGLNSAVQSWWTDIDGQPRTLGLYVDIGADESDYSCPFALYRANLHVHTNASGDTGLPCGMNGHWTAGNPQQILQEARAVGLDLVGLSDHNTAIDAVEWASLASTAADSRASLPSQSLGLRGFEWSWNGLNDSEHINVFGSQGYDADVPDDGVTPIQALSDIYTWLREPANRVSSPVAQFNHVNTGTYFGGFGGYDPALDDAIQLLEIGCGETPLYAQAQDQEDRFKLALRCGWHVGPTIGIDFHNPDEFLSCLRLFPPLLVLPLPPSARVRHTGVWASSYTTTGILDALRSRRTFASEDADALLQFICQVNNDSHWMGAVVHTKPNDTCTFSIYARDIGGEAIKEVRLITPYATDITLPVWSKNPSAPSLIYGIYTAAASALGAGSTVLGERCFYVRVETDDGEFIYSAPIWLTAPPLGAVKQEADGEDVSVAGFTVSARFDDCFYIEAQDRSCGIRCTGPVLLAPGQSGVLQGIMGTTAVGERVLAQATVVGTLGTAPVPKPLSMPCQAIGGALLGFQQGLLCGYGLSNVGLLITTAGKVTFVDPGGQFFTIWDGSAWKANELLRDAAGNLGVRVYAAGMLPPGLKSGDFVTVTGISSCYKPGEDLYPRILVRSAEDIVLHAQ